MWVVHFTDKNGKATVSICQSRDAAFKSAHGLREHFCAVHYISGPNGARIELKEILDWCSQQARNASLYYYPSAPRVSKDDGVQEHRLLCPHASGVN